MDRRFALPLAALALAACSPDFDPASKVDKLRVLAIRAEPPEIEPEGVSTLTSLVLRPGFDPEDPRTTTIVHVACVPEPGNPAPTPCVMLSNLRDPTVAIAEEAQQACAAGAPSGAWPAIQLVGIEACVDATCGPAAIGGNPLPPPELVVTSAVRERFDALPAGAPDRILGVQAVDLAFALEATPDELVAGVGTCPAGDVAANLARLWQTREHVLAMKRVAIRGPEAYDPVPNHNPAIDRVLAGGAELDPSLATTIPAGTIFLDPVALGTREAYTELDASGAPIQAKEEGWVYSWFATTGDLDELHTHDGEHDEWNVGGAPGGAPGVVAVVVRDLRGGTGWAVRKVRVLP
jgi:hypothetical protein